MNGLAKISLLVFVSAAALIGGAGPAYAVGPKPVLIEEAIPAKTFSGRMSVLNATNSVGPGTGIFGVTSITLTNFDTSAQQVFIFVPIFSGGGCGSGGSTIVGGSDPQMTIFVQAKSTLQLTYPTPLVFKPNAGITCIAAEVTTLLHGGSVEIDVNGVVN